MYSEFKIQAKEIYPEFMMMFVYFFNRKEKAPTTWYLFEHGEYFQFVRILVKHWQIIAKS